MKCSLKFITAALRPGEDHLKMGVVNLWINRLIGDAALPDNASFGKMGPRGRGITKIPGWLTDGGLETGRQPEDILHVAALPRGRAFARVWTSRAGSFGIHSPRRT